MNNKDLDKINLSKNEISRIKSLSINKFRNKENLFIVEGDKIVNELITTNAKIKYLIHTEEFKHNYQHIETKIILTDKAKIKKISNLKNPQNVVAVVEIEEVSLKIEMLKEELTLAIDNIQDPGNLGTIIRICDWFGIKNIICSEASVDVYNSKVIQATMGAFLRVNVFYQNLEEFIIKYKEITNNNCYGAFLEGENIYKSEISNNCLLILGNEGNGISKKIEKLIDKKILIPPFYPTEKHAESLNISIATAIICSEFRRKGK
ncbi:MAG: RNA methyltransferase [Bacteroidales bacterium]|jgi:TrmH family RNA methyltransferase|nr:RNA methyltransferase [Bacteroidales bacterium]